MSKIRASVTQILGGEGLHIVSFTHAQQTLTMMGLELPDIKVGSEVVLNIKPSSVGIAKNYSGDFSFSNRLKATITRIDIGEILCVLKLSISPETQIESLLTASSAKKINLSKNDEVDAFFKASELSIHEVLK
ncbi:MAG: TOBE domain-containing protein [Campylobacteraceae bacterium]|jgi:molybdopterin-binding protein|nr:TOBE domain-containing protein [Campylobacteraceae bacterium]